MKKRINKLKNLWIFTKYMTNKKLSIIFTFLTILTILLSINTLAINSFDDIPRVEPANSLFESDFITADFFEGEVGAENLKSFYFDSLRINRITLPYDIPSSFQGKVIQLNVEGGYYGYATTDSTGLIDIHKNEEHSNPEVIVELDSESFSMLTLDKTVGYDLLSKEGVNVYSGPNSDIEWGLIVEKKISRNGKEKILYKMVNEDATVLSKISEDSLLVAIKPAWLQTSLSGKAIENSDDTTQKPSIKDYIIGKVYKFLWN